MTVNPVAVPSIFELEGLRLSYPSRANGVLDVLDAVDVSVRPGEFLSIIGPSGCGKTSLLHLAMGLLEPTGGTIRSSAGSMAMAFQKPQLLPWRTVLDNAVYGLECRGVSRAQAREPAAEMLARMRLGDHLHDYPHELSEGMKQRVNLARALLVEPDLLLMDEPFSALDVTVRRSLQDDLLELWSERRLTVLFVSHALEEVVYLSDRVVVLTDKPTRVRGIESVGLPRPRAGDAEATLQMLRRIDALKDVMEAG